MRSNLTAAGDAARDTESRQDSAAKILAGRKVGIRIEPTTLLFFDLESRELLRTRANPLTPEQMLRLRGLRPAGPPPVRHPSRCACSGWPTTPA